MEKKSIFNYISEENNANNLNEFIIKFFYTFKFKKIYFCNEI